MTKLLVIGVMLLSSSFCWTQDQKQKTSLAFVYQYGKVDGFPSLQVNGDFYKNFSFESSFGIGFRTTLLQGRLFPQLSIGIGYNVLNNISEKLSLSPMISARFSGYSLTTNTRLNYTEVMPGYALTIGNRIRLVQSTFFGKGWEQNNNNDVVTHFWTFSVNLGIGYAF